MCLSLAILHNSTHIPVQKTLFKKLMYTRLSLVDLIRLLWAVFHCFAGVSERVRVDACVSLHNAVVRWTGTYVVPLDPWVR